MPSQKEVDDFMAAEKVVPAEAEMAWTKPDPSRYLWSASVEIEAQLVGSLHLFANPNLPRSWNFKLRLHNEDVYRLDIRPIPSGHDNPPGRPSGFPKAVPEPEHEHVWIEGFDLRCARPVAGLGASDHRAIFEAFCVRTNVRFDPPYVAPQAFEQAQLDTDQ